MLQSRTGTRLLIAEHRLGLKNAANQQIFQENLRKSSDRRILLSKLDFKLLNGEQKSKLASLKRPQVT